jgi:hypothetical protein
MEQHEHGTLAGQPPKNQEKFPATTKATANPSTRTPPMRVAAVSFWFASGPRIIIRRSGVRVPEAPPQIFRCTTATCEKSGWLFCFLYWVPWGISGTFTENCGATFRPNRWAALTLPGSLQEPGR